jgi:hypothetical protein
MYFAPYVLCCQPVGATLNLVEINPSTARSMKDFDHPVGIQKMSLEMSWLAPPRKYTRTSFLSAN